MQWFGEAIDKLYDEVAPTPGNVVAMITQGGDVNAPQGATAEDQLLVQFQGLDRRVRTRPNSGALAARETAPPPAPPR